VPAFAGHQPLLRSCGQGAGRLAPGTWGVAPTLAATTRCWPRPTFDTEAILRCQTLKAQLEENCHARA